LPPGGPLLLGLSGALLYHYRRHLGLRLLLAGSMLAYFTSIPFSAALLNRALQTTPPLTLPLSSWPQSAAIVVLGGGLHQDAPEYGSGPTLHARTLGRLRYAAHLARLSSLPVLASGGPPRADVPSEAELMREVLQEEFGISPVLVENRSRDTWENALYSAALLRERGIETVLLVSNAAHLPRAAAAFTAQGLRVIAAPTLFFNQRLQPLDPQSWLPSVTAIEDMHYAAHEWLGQVWYAWRSRP